MKWGWYATLDELSKGKLWKQKKILNSNVYEMHTFLAHRMDKQRLKANLRKGKNVTQL